MSGYDPAQALRRLAERYGVAEKGVVHLGEQAGGNVLVLSAGRAGLRTLGHNGALLDRIDAAILTAPAERRLADYDRVFFDHGLLRLDDPETAALYLRSDRIMDPLAVGGRTHATVAMSNLGHNAGFANQLFQYAFLRLYGLRHNASVETPPWIGEELYGFPPRRISRRWRMEKGDEFSVRDLALWSRNHPPVDVDFWGYFQNVPATWRAHRAYVRRLFTPGPRWRAPIERWLARHRPNGATLVALHLRRGDYRAYDPAEKPWFQLVPEAWYLRWLDAIWPTLANPVLFIASDDRAAVLPAFRRYAPLTAEDIEAEIPEPHLLADFEIMAAADVLAICNSSFSRMAALLAAPSQRCFLPDIARGAFVPYDPWASDHFWQRFGAPAPRPRVRLPRFLRGLRS